MLALWLATGVLAHVVEAPNPEPDLIGGGGGFRRRIVHFIRRVEDAADSAARGDTDEAEQIARDAANEALAASRRERDESAAALRQIADDILEAGERAREARRLVASNGATRLDDALLYRTALAAAYSLHARLIRDEEDAIIALLLAS